jgi:hypothetical protein
MVVGDGLIQAAGGTSAARVWGLGIDASYGMTALAACFRAFRGALE